MSENQTNSEKKIYDLILIRTIINLSIFLAFVLIFNVNITDSTLYQTFVFMSLALFGFSVGLIEKFFKDEEQKIVILKSIGFVILILSALIFNELTNNYLTRISSFLSTSLNSSPLSIQLIFFCLTIFLYTWFVDVLVEYKKLTTKIPNSIKRMIYINKYN